MLKQILKWPPLWSIIKPGYPDSARLLAQLPVFYQLIRRTPSMKGRCLNAGCGEGLFCPFIEHFSDVTSISNIDLSINPAFLEQHPDRRNAVFTGSLTALPFQAAEFDSAVCTEVLEHIPDDVGAMKELARVLKPGGRLLLSVPQTPAPYDPAHATQGYSFDEMRRKLEMAGFKVVDHEDALFCGTRWIMGYWRKPWFRFDHGRSPYLPFILVRLLAKFDVSMKKGKPWDLVILAERK